MLAFPEPGRRRARRARADRHRARAGLRLRAGVHCGEVVVDARRRHRPRRQRRRPGGRGVQGRPGARHRRRGGRRRRAARRRAARGAGDGRSRASTGRSWSTASSGREPRSPARRGDAASSGSRSSTPAWRRRSTPPCSTCRRIADDVDAWRPERRGACADAGRARPDPRRRRAAVPRRPAPARARGAGARSWPAGSRRAGGTLRPGRRRRRGRTAFLAAVEDAPRRAGCRPRRRACRPTRSGAAPRWPSASPSCSGASGCRCGCSSSERRPGSTCGGTGGATSRAPTAWGDAAAPLRFADELPGTCPRRDRAARTRRRRRRASRVRPVADRSDHRAEGRLLAALVRLARPDGPPRPASTLPSPSPPRYRPPSTPPTPASWLAGRLAEPVPGVATVVFHSIVWQYLPPATRTAIADALAHAGAAATPEAPLAWLRMEPGVRPRQPPPSSASDVGPPATTASSPTPATTATRSGRRCSRPPHPTRRSRPR